MHSPLWVIEFVLVMSVRLSSEVISYSTMLSLYNTGNLPLLVAII